MVFDRLYTAITYALLQFTHQALVRMLDKVVAMVLLSLAGLTLYIVETTSSKVSNALSLLRQFVLLVLAQTGINLAAEQFTVTTASPFALRIECVAATTMLLMLAQAATHLVHESELLSRTVTLLLYMYTDALEVVLHSFVLGSAAMVVSVLVYMVLNLGVSHVQTGFGLSVVARGVGMVCINVLLRTISNESWDLHTKAGSLIFFLFMSDVAITVLPSLDEVRGYILWKTAQIFYSDVVQIVGDVYVGMLLGVLLCMLRSLLPASVWPRSFTTALQLAALVAVNMILGPLGEILAQMQSLENVLVAFNVVILVHTWIHGLLASPSKT